jgi:hypothetical protein
MVMRWDSMIETTHYRTEDYLETPEDIAAYLEAIFEDGDPALICAALSDVDVLLAFLERNMRNHPERLRELPQSLFDRMDAILGDDDVDLDEEIEGDVAL